MHLHCYVEHVAGELGSHVQDRPVLLADVLCRVASVSHVCCTGTTHLGTSSVYVAALFAIFGAGIPMYEHTTWLVGGGQ